VRKDFNNLIRDAKKNKIISEEFANRLTDTVQKITDTFITKAKEMSDKKAHALRAF
jgi:ribosome recycling factor